jgi:xanthine dehydrogenase accessory factor
MIENIYKSLINKIHAGNQCVMVTYLDLHSDRTGSISDKFLLTNEEVDNKSFSLPEEVYEKIHLALDTGKLQFFSIEQNKTILIEPFISNPRLIIFGGGHIARPLSEFASRVGFSVTVIDDRPFFANSARFPEAERVICEVFEESFNLINLKKSDFVVVITRGHKHDGIVLRKLLSYDLSYVGMIGSKRRVNGMREELLNEGFPQDRLDLVNAPIGLDIGAVTPEEISISILSQLISYKNKGVINKLGKSFSFPEFDVEVAEKMSEESYIPKALLTILSTKGSVPRKAGAKMVAYYDGRTVGSIGGGCSEAEVISKARDVIISKGFSIEHVDMTGDVAESEGMVCGGIMEVLVEAF